jgi:hypothetical protein
MAIPEDICIHFTLLATRCELGNFAQRDCPGCHSYLPGTKYLKPGDPVDAARSAAWADYPGAQGPISSGGTNV